MVALEKLTGGALSREEQVSRDEGAQNQKIEHEHGHSLDAPHVVESSKIERKKEVGLM